MAAPRPARIALDSPALARTSAAAGAPPPPIPARTYQRRASARTADEEAVPASPVEAAKSHSESPLPPGNAAVVTEQLVSSTMSRAVDLVCKECGFANTAPGACYSCASPLEGEEEAVDVVVALPASLRCAACSHMNYLDAQRCAACGASFATDDSFLQEDVFGGLNEELGRMSDAERNNEDEETLRALMGAGDEKEEKQDEEYSSMIAPEFAAPVAPRGRKQTLLAQYAERMHAKPELARDSSSDSAVGEAPLVSMEAVQAFVVSAIGTQGWEPTLTIKAGEGVERFVFRGTQTLLKSQMTLPRTTPEEAEQLVWPLMNVPRYDALMYECKLLKKVSESAMVVHLTLEISGLGRLDVVCGRVRGVLPSGERYVLMQSIEWDQSDMAVIVTDLVKIKTHGLLLINTDNGGTKCIHVSHNEYDATLAAAGALSSKASWNVLIKVLALNLGGATAGSARPPPPSHAPAPSAIRKLTIVKIPVKLASERDKVANEILTSEQAYFQSLLILGSFYIGPILHAALAGGNTLIYETFQAIGYAADALVPYNQALLSELENKMRSWDADSTLGDNFHMVGRFQMIYTKYLQAYSDMIPKMAMCEKNVAFAAQMRDLKKAGITNQLDLRSYLIMPVQRFPRYELLLRDLLRATPPSHKDAHFIRTALSKVEAVNQAINAAMQEATNRQKLAEISALFVADPGIRGDGKRKLLREGVLVKQCQSSRANRKFFLFSDLLLYAKMVPGTGLFTSERYLLSEKVPLSKLHLEDRADDESVDPPVRHSFVIQSGKKSFALFASSDEDKSEWLLAVSNATAQLMAEEETKAAAASDAAAEKRVSSPSQGSAAEADASAGANEQQQQPDIPAWQEDSSVTSCPICGGKFNSILQRKHHCRLCGHVACAACSEGRVIVPAWGDDQLRVCKPCYAADKKGVVKVMPVSPRLLATAGKNLSGSLSNIMARGSKREK